MSFVCPHCTERITVDDSVAGSEITCPHCQKKCPAPRRKLRLRLPSDGLASAPVANASQPQCPQCKVAMAAAAVFCVKCGFDLRTGKNVLASSVRPRPNRKWLILSVVCVMILVAALVRIYSFLHEPEQSSPVKLPAVTGKPTGKPTAVSGTNSVPQKTTRVPSPALN